MNKDTFSFFTDKRLPVIVKMDLANSIKYIKAELELETKEIRHGNILKINKLINNVTTHKKLIESAYNFRLASEGLRYIN